jgi:flagellar motor switch/type III secretory pathway protein FliN
VTVLIDDEAFLARLTVPAATLGIPLGSWNRGALALLGDAEIAIPIVATASLASADNLAKLAPGDAWIPEAWPLKRLGGCLVGPVLLVPAESEAGVPAELGADGRLVLRAGAANLSWSSATGPLDASPPREEETMTEHDTNPIVEALGDIPIVVRVEIGTAQMPAREWSSLGPGDVVGLGRRIAEPVVLRVGGAEVARGELVDIEGEVGVRIVSRTPSLPADTAR